MARQEAWSSLTLHEPERKEKEGKKEEREENHTHTHTHTLVGPNHLFINCISAHAYLYNTQLPTCICVCIHIDRQICIHLVDGAEPQQPHFIFFSQPFYSFLDKSFLENYLRDKMLHKGELQNDADS